MLLKEAILRNTAWVIGVVVYTGPETKVLMNNSTGKQKMSNIERFINRTAIVMALI